ncbi:MAG: hypothetical protein WCG31_02930 [Deltaproteobacteria bacterium]|jgi:hypothetical protein
MLLHLAMIAAGIAAITWGLPLSHRLRRPLDLIAALVVLAGVLLALLGVLLAAVPRFFQG